jgi:RimJ/RimL family protein N-acetyltransferase
LEVDISNAKEAPLKESDIRSIVEIECHPKVREWLIEYVDGNVEKEFQVYRRFFRNLQKHRRVEIIIAKYDGRLVGFLGLWRLGRYMQHVAGVGVSVHPDFWGNGIATQLIEFAIDTARAKGVKRLEIETLAENSAMRRVAEKAGFKLESIRKNRIQKDEAYHDEASYFLLL